MNAIISYNAIFNTVTPFNTPPNLKNGKFSYSITDTGFLSKKAKTIVVINPSADTNDLVNPLLKPKTAPNKIKIIMIKSTIFILSTFLLKLYYILRKK